MAKKTFYVLGKTDEGSNPYNDGLSYDRLKFFICDSVSDLPASGMSGQDMAIVIDSGELYTVKDSAWVGNSNSSCFPIGCIFSCAIDTDPSELLGFGVWELVAKEPFYAWQRKE